MSRVLIVHADDFNLTRGVNEGILRGFRDGTVRSTSIMANRPGLPGSVEALKAAGMDVGLHFNLTLGRPMSRPEELSSLVEPGGQFRKRDKLHNTPLVESEIRAELVAQIGALHQLGLLITHIDTHHHIHEHEQIFGTMVEVARTMGLALRCYGEEMYRILQAEGIRSPRYIVTRFYGEEDVKPETLTSIVAELPDGITELCCHPAVVDEDLRAISSYHEPRARELDLLCSPAWLETLKQADVRLASYADAF